MSEAPMHFSIVIPVRNGENYLASAIGSAIAQTRRPDEILVIDDNSTDRTAEIAKSPEWRARVGYSFNEQASGFVDAWNRAASWASGDFVTILHHDDTLAPDYLATVETALARHPDVRHAYASCRYIDSAGTGLAVPPTVETMTGIDRLSGRDYARRYFHGVLANQHIHRCPGVTTHRDLLTQQCAYRKDAGHIADDDFFMRVGAFTDVVGIQQPLASYRLHNESATGQLSLLSLTLARDWVFQLQEHSGGETLLDDECLRGMNKLASKLLDQAMFHSIRLDRQDWIERCREIRRSLREVSCSTPERDHALWARILWLLDGTSTSRMRGHVARKYVGLLQGLLYLRDTVRPRRSVRVTSDG